MRPILVAIKLLLNRFRGLFNIYNLLLAVSFRKKSTARLLGSVLAAESEITGSLSLYEPAWFQMNRNSRCGSIALHNNSFLLIDHGADTGDLEITMPTIITKKTTYSRSDTPIKRVTISVDLEGGVGLSHASKRLFNHYRSKWDSRSTAEALYMIFKKYSLPATWATCGHLFLESCDKRHEFEEQDWYGNWFSHDPGTTAQQNSDWYMPDFIRMLIDDPIMELGYHSFGHFNYLNAGDQTIKKDLEWADRLRRQFAVPLKTIVFPYNAVSHIEELTANGFTSLRGYIGQYYLPMTVDFGSFTLFGTSMFLGPRNIHRRTTRVRECIGKNFNFFLHPEDWVGLDISQFEKWCRALAELQQKGLVAIGLMGADEN